MKHFFSKTNKQIKDRKNDVKRQVVVWEKSSITTSLAKDPC